MMWDAAEHQRQVRLLMLMVSELAPGSVCMNTKCPTGTEVPHMANDGGPHPSPYGLIETPTYEWRHKPRRRWPVRFR